MHYTPFFLIQLTNKKKNLYLLKNLQKFFHKKNQKIIVSYKKNKDKKKKKIKIIFHVFL